MPRKPKTHCSREFYPYGLAAKGLICGPGQQCRECRRRLGKWYGRRNGYTNKGGAIFKDGRQAFRGNPGWEIVFIVKSATIRKELGITS